LNSAWWAVPSFKVSSNIRQLPAQLSVFHT
jgi:hypothetical protein